MLIPESTTVDDAEHDRLMSLIDDNDVRPTFELGSSGS